MYPLHDAPCIRMRAPKPLNNDPQTPQYDPKGMEPLVEVHTDREMEIALAAGAKVIGVNNRNLHTFKLDLDTTERAIGIAAKKGFSWQLTASGELPDIMIAALSGITSSDDVALFRKAGVSCVLVGETLMKSSDPKQVTPSQCYDPLLCYDPRPCVVFSAEVSVSTGRCLPSRRQHILTMHSYRLHCRL